MCIPVIFFLMIGGTYGVGYAINRRFSTVCVVDSDVASFVNFKGVVDAETLKTFSERLEREWLRRGFFDVAVEG